MPVVIINQQGESWHFIPVKVKIEIKFRNLSYINLYKVTWRETVEFAWS